MMQRPFFIVLVTCICTFGLSACGGTSDSDEDANPPTEKVPEQDQDPGRNPEQDPDALSIRSRSPESDATNRALVTDIEFRFNETLIAETVSSDTIWLSRGDERVETRLDFDDGSDRVRLRPETSLAPDTLYRVNVSDEVMAADGTTFSGSSWTFTTAANVGPTPQAILDACMSDSDIEMLGRINDARAQSRQCGDHDAPAVKPLQWHCGIEEAAQRHSDDMAENNFFSHTGSDGTGAGERLSEADYGWQTAAENIAAGQRSVEQVMTALLESPGHCVNIMGENFTEVGTGVADNPDSTYGRYWTQNFARPW